MQEKFVPLIADTGGNDSLKAAKAALRGIFSTLLRNRECAEAVAEFKSNGSVTGHKVLDDRAAVEALIAKASKEMGEQIHSLKLNEWNQIQALNQVLSRYFEMHKGKLTGQPSRRLLKNA